MPQVLFDNVIPKVVSVPSVPCVTYMVADFKGPVKSPLAIPGSEECITKKKKKLFLILKK